MKYLLDTQVIIWFLSQDSRLGSKTRKLIVNNSEHSCVSYVTAWEITIKTSLGKIRMKRPLEEYIKQTTLSWLPIHLEHFENVLHLPHLHRDPFDRLLIAQSISEKLTLITGDKDILQYRDVLLINARR